jgi:hypothetical protein
MAGTLNSVDDHDRRLLPAGAGGPGRRPPGVPPRGPRRGSSGPPRIDHLRFPAREALTGQRYQQQLAVVLQQHLRSAATEPLYHVSDQGPDEMGRQFVRAVEDLSEESLSETLGAVRAPSCRQPLTCHGQGRACMTKDLSVPWLHLGVVDARARRAVSGCPCL